MNPTLTENLKKADRALALFAAKAREYVREKVARSRKDMCDPGMDEETALLVMHDARAILTTDLTREDMPKLAGKLALLWTQTGPSLPEESPATLGTSSFLEHVHHAYAQTDGTYKWPNSREGDMLRQAKKEIEELRARSNP